MSEALFAGSAAAAFAAGLVAFFAPCCAGVMVPTYLAAVGQGSRWRVTRLTALYVAGVAAVVWPITLGVGAVSQLISRWHPVLFVTGGLIMIGVAVALWRGSMLPVSVPQPKLSGSPASVFVLGAFSGAATACCAPVLAGAVALSTATGSWFGGGLLGGVYILGLVSPLLPLTFAWDRVGERLRDPRLTLRAAGYTKRLTLSRLVGAVVFAGFGTLFISLALTGNTETSPGFQRSLGLWVNRVTRGLDSVPNTIAWPLVVAAVAAFAYLVVRPAKTKEKAS